MVMLGLDLFPDYATYTAADIPVVGVLPILPADYTANALFLTGGNATTMAAMAAVAKDHFQAKKVGIVSADNPGANGDGGGAHRLARQGRHRPHHRQGRRQRDRRRLPGPDA